MPWTNLSSLDFILYVIFFDLEDIIDDGEVSKASKNIQSLWILYEKIEDGSFHPFNLRFFWWIFHWFRFNFLSIVWFIYVTFHHTTNHFVIPEKRKSFDIIRFSTVIGNWKSNDQCAGNKSSDNHFLWPIFLYYNIVTFKGASLTFERDKRPRNRVAHSF